MAVIRHIYDKKEFDKIFKDSIKSRKRYPKNMDFIQWGHINENSKVYEYRAKTKLYKLNTGDNYTHLRVWNLKDFEHCAIPKPIKDELYK